MSYGYLTGIAWISSFHPAIAPTYIYFDIFINPTECKTHIYVENIAGKRCSERESESRNSNHDKPSVSSEHGSSMFLFPHIYSQAMETNNTSRQIPTVEEQLAMRSHNSFLVVPAHEEWGYKWTLIKFLPWRTMLSLIQHDFILKNIVWIKYFFMFA